MLAPPGSGKTEMLSQRIIHALAHGVSAGKMLCATFTNRAAFEMRARVSAAAGNGCALPDVGNIHHFCHGFLQSVERIRSGRHVLDESQQLDFIYEVTEVLREELRGGRPADLKKTHGVSVMPMIKGICEPMRLSLMEIIEELFADYEADDKSPYPDILSAVLISHQWKLGIPSCYLRQVPSQMLELVSRGVIAALEQAYTGLKRKFLSVDFDDLINETFLYLAKNPLPDERRFDWIQIDEVQDLNPLQWYIVRELTSSRAVSVYFGDVEQSIFSFLGASTSSFASAVAGCERHYFKTNFRATPLLLEVLMRYSLETLRSGWEFLPTPSDVMRANGEVTLSTGDSENAVLGKVRHLLDGEVAENVAILVRTNHEADAYERLVHGLGYRTVKVSGRDLFAYPPMRDFLAFVSLVVGNPPRTTWVSLVRRFADGVFSTVSARYLVRSMFASRWNPMSIFASRDPLPSLPRVWRRSSQWAWRNRRALSSLRRRLKPFYEKAMESCGQKADFRALYAMFREMALGAKMCYAVRELVPELKKMEALLGREVTTDEARQYAFKRMELFFRYLDFVYGEDPRTLAEVLAEDWRKISQLKEADLLVGDEKIVISTVHKAKGRQFDAVIIPSVAQMAISDAGDDNEESLRLLYVAMSRAQRHLALLGCKGDGILRDLEECFGSGYRSYYLRRALGEDTSHDWLCEWENLAQAKDGGRCSMELVGPALGSGRGAVVRMALKVLLHHPERGEARSRWLEALAGDFAETSVGCMQEAGVYDREARDCVRKLSLSSTKMRDHRAALEYFKAGLSAAREYRAELVAAIGDFIYHYNGMLRLEAATCLITCGVTRWKDVIRGASADFMRLQSVADDSHEEAIRTILKRKLPNDYEHRLREILFARAMRAR